jgi:non-homologous end joining protein Ku
MRVKELREILNRIPERHDDDEVCVEVFRKNAMGGTPTVRVRSIHNGFDWDRGKFIIHTETDLKEISKEEKRDINIDTIIG